MPKSLSGKESVKDAFVGLVGGTKLRRLGSVMKMVERSV